MSTASVSAPAHAAHSTGRRQNLVSRCLYQLHLWLGLASALIAFVLCFSGAMLIVQIPVEHWVNRHVQQVSVPPAAERLPLESLLPQVQAATGKAFTGLTLPADPAAALILHEGRAATYVNPYTGDVLGGIHQPTRDFFMFWFRLHRWLLLDTELGRPITGVATVIFLFLGLSGIWLWVRKALPNPRRALWFKKGVSWRRTNYDLHLILGIYAVIPLMVMALSGLFWTWRTPFVQTTHLLLNGQLPPAPERKAQDPQDKAEKQLPRMDLPYTQMLAHPEIQQVFRGDLNLRFPETPGAAVAVTKTRKEALRIPLRERWKLDADSGAIVEYQPFASLSRAEKVLSQIKAIHMGTILGGPSLWLYFIAVLAGATLPLTGAIHWAQRIWKRRARRPNPAASSE